MRSREKVAKLEKESGNLLNLFPRREIKKAEPNGIATNRGIIITLLIS
jgi:hypothetical protein